MTMDDARPQLGDSYPRPDPTRLTSQALTAAIAGLKDVLDTRLAGVDQTIEVIQADIRARPGAIVAEIHHLQALHEEKFGSIQVQFKERDTRSERESRDNEIRVNAAFAAQKEAAAKQDESNQKAIDKSEKGTTDQITQQRALLESTTRNTNDKIDDLKERLTRIESIAVGQVTAKAEVATTHTTATQHTGTLIGIGGFIIALVVLLERFAR